MKILVTGGCGFIGHHFIEHLIKNTNWNIVVLDKLTYASNGFDRLRDINCFDNKKIKIFTINLNQPISEGVKREIGEVDYVVNFASESHVDNSITDPVNFIQNNVNLMLYMLEWARKLKNLKKFIQFSTDEVYSTAPEGVYYKEGDRFNPGNPYSASKASQECIAMAYRNTYGLPMVITNTMNVIGERQHSEKFVPLCVKKILKGERVAIHADKAKTKAGTRFYIHARNVANALCFVLTETNELLDKMDASKGKFNIVGEREIDNLTLAQMIAEILGKKLKYEMVDFHSSRPGHDLRYAISDKKMKMIGWKPPKDFNQSLIKTIKWIVAYPKWLEV